MPEERTPPVIIDANLEAEPLKLGMDALNEAYALATVKETFHAYELFRQNNHDWRWAIHDALYFGWVPPKYWENTTTKRSSLGMPITFDQIESAHPAISQALFTDEEWFDVSPNPGASPQEARAIQAHLKYALEHGQGNYSTTSQNELELAIHSVLQYGNGAISTEWDADLGYPVSEWVDIKDLYFDPGLTTPVADGGRAIIRRRMMTVDDVDELRAHPSMHIPDKPVLMHMARTASSVAGDRTKQAGEAARGVNYSPAQDSDWAPVPADRKIEVLIYYSKDRIIWVLNREWVAYNEQNPYGFTPICAAPCFPVVGRFYAQSYADVLEGNQRYIEALLNARLDELSLSINPPRARKRGGMLTPAQQRWRPGQVTEFDDPKNDMVVHFPQQATANVAAEIAYLEASSDKRTGTSSIAQGVPRPGNANRTAGGMGMQMQGSASRLHRIVKHIEDYLIVPMLYKMYKLVQFHTVPGQTLPGLDKESQFVQVGAENFQKPCRFVMRASSKMLTKEKLAQVFPFMAQYLLNGAFLSEMQKTGNTVDFMEFFRLLQDATGTGRAYSLVRPLSQQEQEAMRQPPPEVVAEQQRAQMDAQTKLQLGQQKGEYDLKKEALKKQPDAQEQQLKAQEAQLEMQMKLMELEFEKKKAELDLQIQVQKLELEKAKAQIKIQTDQQSAQNKMFLDAAMGQQKLQLSQVQAEQQMRMGEMEMEHAGRAGEQKMAMDKKSGDMKMKMMERQAQMKQKSAAEKKPTEKKAA